MAEFRIHVPRSMLKQQEMYTDIFYWNHVGFMLTIALPLRVRFATKISKSETSGYIKTLLENHINMMREHGFVVRSVNVDPQLFCFPASCPSSLPC